MRRPGRQDDHGPAARSIIARIDRALTGLPEVRPGAGPYLCRLAECGWSGGTPPPQELLRHDRARQNLDRHPNYILAAYMSSGT